MLNKMIFCTALLFVLGTSIRAFESYAEGDDSSLVSDAVGERCINRFSFSTGVGTALGIAGVCGSFDFGKYWGVDVSMGVLRFPCQISVRYNFYVDRLPLVISPEVSIFEFPWLDKNHNLKFWPGVGVGADFSSYLNQYWFVRSNLGLEYTFTDEKDYRLILPHTGISLGYTFGGENPAHHWIKDEQGPTIRVALLNATVGAFFSIILPWALFHNDFATIVPAIK